MGRARPYPVPMTGLPRPRDPRWWGTHLRDAAWIRAALLDVLLAVVAAYAAVTLTAEVTSAASGWRGAAAEVVAFLHGSSIALRRAATGAMLGLLLGTAVVYVALGYPVYLLGPAVLFAAYTLGARWPRRRGLIALVVVEGATAVLIGAGATSPGLDSLALFLGLITAAWFLGDILRRWQTLAREHSAQVRELEVAREELARHAVTAERVRIARELHDVVAHCMSIVAMHAGAGRLAVGTDPQAEREALRVIEDTTRVALGEMRRLVAVLREEGAAQAPLGPVHGLGDLPELTAGVAAAGVTIDVRTSGDLASLPDGVSLAAYRVVQEALTNVVRHAAPTRARVVVAAGADDTVRLSVENDPGAQRPSAGGGHGTTGMRERVELYGGTFASGPAEGGGWRVVAELPAGHRISGTPR
jgi:signal transduction histidine kinase